jgi:hypothetical protein
MLKRPSNHERHIRKNTLADRNYLKFSEETLVIEISGKI